MCIFIGGVGYFSIGFNGLLVYVLLCFIVFRLGCFLKK